MDENMSSLTCASGQITASSGSTLYSQQSFASTNQAPQPKKKRSLPGNPDPDAEVVALSPKTLLATNRFICEICNKGFQRDQNLQLHKRGHNLPWKLKQKTNKEVMRKKVYLCPEATCVHHDPSRALGDLTGIKKHFCRKHGEKKWKCEKCSKRYAVQSDLKAHSKICGTREYRCDCGTLFSRRDSFITHRAFCDALAEERVRTITSNPILSSHQHQQPMINLQTLTVKREQESHHFFNPRQDNINIPPPPWILGEGGGGSCPPLFSPSLDHHHHHQPILHNDQNPSSNPNNLTTLPPYQHTTTASPHMSATALLQKAAQMGVTMRKPSPSPAASSGIIRPHGFSSTSVASSKAGSGHLGLSSREHIGSGFAHGLASFGNKAAVSSAIIDQQMLNPSPPPPAGAPSSSPLVHDMISSFSSASGFDDEEFNGLLNPKRDANGKNYHEILSKSTESQFSRSDHREGGRATIIAAGNDGLTRDFLGLKPISHKDFLNIASIFHIDSSSTYPQQNQCQSPWQG